ncbi:MAG: 3-hydroxybutyrate dehydrogenase [Paraglaciecola sp.]|uniref:3-hydroxybutyrate dehydrogenase n=1 Tax=Paraglaciecola sp. TaxID=1920173 RepID=UPI003267F0CB
MENKNILITGGASGIGFGIAEHLGRLGHHIIIADINLAAAELASIKLHKENIKATALELDVTNAINVASLPQTLAPITIDVLINNAGIQHVSKLEDFPSHKWQQLIDIMLVAPALLSQALLPAMRHQNYGRIINIGSVHSVIASPFKSAYVAAKHGLLGFSKTLALETGDCDVTVNTLCPAYVKTPLVENQIAAQAIENDISEQEVVDKIMLAPMPKKAFIDIEEVGALAAFLLTDAAKNITAQALVIDGGWTAR